MTLKSVSHAVQGQEKLEAAAAVYLAISRTETLVRLAKTIMQNPVWAIQPDVMRVAKTQ